MALTLVPSYGRDYPSKQAVEADFHSNKDFTVRDISSPYDGKPVNKVDLQSAGVNTINIRYSKNRKVVVINLTGE